MPARRDYIVDWVMSALLAAISLDATPYGGRCTAPPMGVGEWSRMKTVCGHVPSLEWQVHPKQFALFISFSNLLQHPIELFCSRAKVPPKRLRQCRKAVHWGEARQEHMPSTEFRLQKPNQFGVPGAPAS